MSHEVYLDGRPEPFAVAADETILQAGLRHQLMLPHGCQSGSCASCRVRLLKGEVTYPFEPPGLSTEEISAGYILMCLARPASDLLLALDQPADAEALRPQQMPCRVQSRRWLSHDVLGLTLKLPRRNPGDPAFRYLPGQYIDLLLEDGRRRSFSMANAPNGESLELHIRVTPEGRFAQWAAHEMPERAILRFEGPLGAFYLRETSTRPIVMVAGGTGIAPMHAILEQLLQQPLQRPVWLYWGVRTEADLYLHELLGTWAAAHENFHYCPVLSASSESEAVGTFERGWVHEAPLRQHADLHAFDAYLSGPPVMVRAAKSAFVEAGLSPDHLYYDAFEDAHTTWPDKTGSET